MSRSSTTGYSAGRVCYPTRRDAQLAIVSGRRETRPGSARALAWWPRHDFRRIVELLRGEPTQRDYMRVEDPR